MNLETFRAGRDWLAHHDLAHEADLERLRIFLAGLGNAGPGRNGRAIPDLAALRLRRAAWFACRVPANHTWSVFSALVDHLAATPETWQDAEGALARKFNADLTAAPPLSAEARTTGAKKRGSR